MSDGRRSFWSTVPGLVTGLAGLLTGIVGLVTVLIQLGVIGGNDSGDKTTAATGTTVTSLSDGGGGGTGSTVFGAPAGTSPTIAGEVPTFTVTPTALDFQPSDPKEKVVTIANTSGAATLTVPVPTVTGPDKDRFTASYGTCTGAPLPARGSSCTVKVTFSPSGPLRTYSASLHVAPSGVPVAKEVALTATTVL